MDGSDDSNPDALTRIEQVDKRLHALQELGQDTATLRSQLAFARTRLAEGAADDALRICDEVLLTARRQANSSGEHRMRTIKTTRDELALELHTILSRGLFARLQAENPAEPGPRIESRLEAFDLHIREYLQASHRGLAHTCEELRRDLDQAVTELRTALAASPAATVADDIEADATNAPNAASPATAALATLATFAERLDQRLASAQEQHAQAGDAWREALTHALSHSIATPLMELRAATERLAEPRPTPELTALDTTVREGLDHLRTATERLAEPHENPALTTLDSTVRDGLANVRDAVLATKLDQDALLTAVRELAVNHTTSDNPIDHAGLDRLITSLEESQMALIEGLASGFSRLAEIMERRPAPPPAAPVDQDQIKALIRDELAERLGNDTVPRLVQQALADPAITERLLGLIAMEAVSHPGVLGELTGLRSFLRRELRIAVEAYAKDALPV